MAARSYRVSRAIEAPSAVVWALLIDTAGYARWNRAVLRIDGSIERGSTIRLVSVAAPKRTFALQVAELTEPTRMVWASGMPLGLFRGRRTFTIEDRGAGGCRFDMHEAFSGVLAGPMSRAIPDLTDSFASFADCLKAAAEAVAPPSPPA